MKVPLSWLREYVEIDLSNEELAHRLTMAGLEVGGITVVGANWENVFVGYVEKVEHHPNADRLSLVTVDIGKDHITAVCGAPNVAVGQRVAFALPGAIMLNPETGEYQQLKAAKIRGVTSQGMVCSEKELGLGDDHTGILVLEGDVPIGAPMADYFGDVVLELEPTTNRPDWLSVLGVAHEVAALTRQRVSEPVGDYLEEGKPIKDQVDIRVEDTDLALRYTASLVTGVKIGPSPQWMQERLVKSGQRPINNIVDITNYVMLEYGQPLHAFDYGKLEKKSVLVRRSRPEEGLVTLDGENRQLSSEMLVIADDQRAIGLAGVMGGLNTEMTDETTAVLLESAKFDAVNIRRTATKLRLRSEASTRFERDLNGELASIALRRATALILQLAGGKAAKGIIDLDAREVHKAKIRLTLERVEKVLGMCFDMKEVLEIFIALGFKCETQGEKAVQVELPYWRSDVSIEDDLVEELARVKGYDNIPTTSLRERIPPRRKQPMLDLRENVRDLLAMIGMQETISHSLVGVDSLQQARVLEADGEILALANPMTPEHSYLRTSLVSNALRTVGFNLRHSEHNLRLFEIGKVYIPQGSGLPKEREMVVGVFCGDSAGLSWTEEQRKLDFFDSKGTLEVVLEALGLQPKFRGTEVGLLQPGRTAEVLVEGQRIGIVGEVHPEVLAGFDIEDEKMALFELDLEELLPHFEQNTRRFIGLSRFPGSYRDLGLVVDVDVAAVRIKEIIERHPLVVWASVFDIYTGDELPEGKSSLAFRIQFQSNHGTLKTETVNEAQKVILSDLERETGAQLRG
ncbi:MAG: phenylalanine--tRNA ligase subunit beta [SAR202 cluster bacterium Io17-Chloro-G3]|nr:MAG: phenylalanine--tRNA ligase subunit beta [SAR202 cluster bacterium Io17-Chloro-G3]